MRPTNPPPAPQVPSSAPVKPTYGTPNYPFAAGAELNQPIAATATLSSESKALAAHLASGPIADTQEFGKPMYTSYASDPALTVTCTMYGGLCSMRKHIVHVPVDAHPSLSTDHGMTIYDTTDHLDVYLYAVGSRTSQTLMTGYAAASNYTSPNFSKDAITGGANAANGAGIEGGVVTLAQLQSGVIAHALVFSTDITCDYSVQPASHSDGHGKAPDCIPEGARIRLNPRLNPSAYDLNLFERPIFVALQRYGAFVVDTGGAPAAFSFENTLVEHGNDAGYKALGDPRDYYTMPDIPWAGLQVLSFPSKGTLSNSGLRGVDVVAHPPAGLIEAPLDAKAIFDQPLTDLVTRRPPVGSQEIVTTDANVIDRPYYPAHSPDRQPLAALDIHL